jgi:hypothetical protein
MIRPDMPFHDLYSMRSTDFPHKIPQPQSHITTKDRSAVFGYENEVVVKQKDRVRRFTISLHANKIPQTS